MPGLTVRIALSPPSIVWSASSPHADPVFGVARDKDGIATGDPVFYYSSDITVATVDANTGALTRVGAGTCTIFAMLRPPSLDGAPVYIDEVSTPTLYLADSNNIYNQTVRTAAGMNTYGDISGTVVAAGLLVCNQDGAAITLADLTVDATDVAAVSSATLGAFTSAHVGGVLDVTAAGTGLTVAKFYIQAVAGGKAYVGSAWKGSQGGLNAIGSVNAVGTATFRFANAYGNGGAYYFWEAQNSGLVGKGAGPHGAGATYLDDGGVVTWINRGTVGSKVRVSPVFSSAGSGDIGNAGALLVPGINGIGLAAQNKFVIAEIPFTNAAIDAGDNTKLTIPGVVPELVVPFDTTTVVMDSGAGFTVGNFATDGTTLVTPRGKITKAIGNWGTAGATGGVGKVRINQQGSYWKVVAPGVTPSTDAVVMSVWIKLNADGTFAIAPHDKFARANDLNFDGGTPQPGTADYIGGAPGYPATIDGVFQETCFSWINGFIGSTIFGPITNLVSHPSDPTLVKSATGLQSGLQLTINAGGGFNGLVACDMRPTTNGGGVTGWTRILQAGVPVSCGGTGLSGGSATIIRRGYPFDNDNGAQAFPPYPLQLFDNKWHRYVYALRSHDAENVWNGLFRLHIGDTTGALKKVIDISYAAMNVTAPGAAKQWCSPAEVFGMIPCGSYPWAGQWQMGGVNTAPALAFAYYMSMNLGSGVLGNPLNWHAYRVPTLSGLNP